MTDPGLLAQQLIQKHFPKFGSMVVSCTYQQMNSAVYTASSGNVVESIVSSTTVGMIWDEFGFAVLKADDSTILSIDRKVIFPSLDLPVSPTIGDRVVDDSGLIWIVKGISVDPAKAHYELHVRPLDG